MEHIQALELELRKAMMTGNTVTLERLLHQNMIFTSQTGDVLTKSADISVHASGKLKIRELTQSEQAIREYRNVAVVSVKCELKGEFDNQAFGGTYRYTRVWKLTEGSWQIIAAQASECIS